VAAGPRGEPAGGFALNDEAAWLSEAESLRRAAPRGWLFLCVANSARSQLAEGIARSLAPADVWIGSAGSKPTSVRPEAAEVLAEIGIDIATHHSKGMRDLPAERVEAVVTLCADEVCPAWLGHAHRVHWGLPDPAAVEGPGRLDAFRDARDEIRRRLIVVFR
jgi:protein-tyrosine-phosphatase